MTEKIAWSHSRLKDFSLCRAMYHAKHIAKIIKFVSNKAMDRGNRIHKSLERAAIRIVHDNPPEPNKDTKVAMPMLTAFAATHDKLYIEEELAFDVDLAPCSWFSKKAWFRVKVDIYGRKGPATAYQDQVFSGLDWKTGKVRIDDLDQLKITNLGLFLKHRDAVEVSSTLVFLDYKQTSPIVTAHRKNLDLLLEEFSEKAEEVQIAAEKDLWPTTKNYSCAWCKVPHCKHARGV